MLGEVQTEICEVIAVLACRVLFCSVLYYKNDQVLLRVEIFDAMMKFIDDALSSQLQGYCRKILKQMWLKMNEKEKR